MFEHRSFILSSRLLRVKRLFTSCREHVVKTFIKEQFFSISLEQAASWHDKPYSIFIDLCKVITFYRALLRRESTFKRAKLNPFNKVSALKAAAWHSLGADVMDQLYFIIGSGRNK